jgi:hypothetical protein
MEVQNSKFIAASAMAAGTGKMKRVACLGKMPLNEGNQNVLWPFDRRRKIL